MKIAHPKTNITRTFAKLCFDFIRDIVTIELGFRQQVAAEVLKNIPKLSFRCKSRVAFIDWLDFICRAGRVQRRLLFRIRRDSGNRSESAALGCGS